MIRRAYEQDDRTEYGRLISLEHQQNGPVWYHFNALGCTVALTDETQTVTDEYIYRAFGDQTQHAGTSDNPHTWIGELGYYNDGDGPDEQYFLRARHYQPQTARFLSQAE